jgi:hypothetical protein
MLPELVAALMLEPGAEDGRHRLEALQPHLAPVFARDERVGRPPHDREIGRAPFQIAGEMGAAHVVHVVGIAVVGRAIGDDGLERRGPAGRDLERVEAAPGDAHHADGAAAPGLLREPGDRLDRVVLFLLQIFVEHHPFGIAGAADIEPHAGIAVGRDIGMRVVVPVARAVAPAIGDIFEDRRHGLALGILRHPDARREPGAVRHRDPHRLDMADSGSQRSVIHGRLLDECRIR